MASQMLEQIYRKVDGRPALILVDLGYVNDKASRDRADAIIAAGIGKSNVSLEGFNRLFIKIPPKKAAAIFARFPGIVAGATYYQSTHNWLTE